jgi:hypothetical protein
MQAMYWRSMERSHPFAVPTDGLRPRYYPEQIGSGFVFDTKLKL